VTLPQDKDFISIEQVWFLFSIYLFSNYFPGKWGGAKKVKAEIAPLIMAGGRGPLKIWAWCRQEHIHTKILTCTLSLVFSLELSSTPSITQDPLPQGPLLHLKWRRFSVNSTPSFKI
jgi:hypothetical protein